MKSNPPLKKSVYLETLGCAKNRVDSEIMMAALERHGYRLVSDPAEARVILVNTCAFLTTASEESIGRLLTLSDFKKGGSCEKLVCAGCLSERYREELLSEIPELDGLLGSSDFHEIPGLLDDLYNGRPGKNIHLAGKPHYTHYERQERLQSTPAHYVYLKVAEGCSNMCSFCNIPALRGYFSSRGMESIIEEMAGHVARGVKEINLISQDISSYGLDRQDGAGLAALLRATDRLEGDFWLRLFYAYPNTFGEEALEALAESRHLVPYLDMPFQHISDSVLLRMNRRITEREIRQKLAAIKERLPSLALRTTLMVGFPTEEEADFLKLLALVEEGWFDHLGVFEYSHEDNILSKKFGDPIPARIKRQRRKTLLAAQQKIAAARNAEKVGQVLKVLVEGASPETELLLQGRASFQGPEVDGVVLINEGQARAGDFHQVEITEAHAYDLVGRIVE